MIAAIFDAPAIERMHRDLRLRELRLLHCHLSFLPQVARESQICGSEVVQNLAGRSGTRPDAYPARRARPVLLPSSSYLLASYCHAPILKTLLGSIFSFRARSRFMVSCGNTPSISASLSGMALFKYVVT